LTYLFTTLGRESQSLRHKLQQSIENK
jgi:hypothetical protein